MSNRTKYLRIAYIVIPVVTTLFVLFSLYLGANYHEFNSNQDYFIHPLLTSLFTPLYLTVLGVSVYLVFSILLLFKNQTLGLKKHWIALPIISLVIILSTFALNRDRQGYPYWVVDTVYCNGKVYDLITYAQGSAIVAESENLIYLRKVSGVNMSDLFLEGGFNTLEADWFTNKEVGEKIMSCLN
ncbi:MAG: hypothetical protein AAGF07_00095 [Patescibacteria group bacterium]